MLVKMLKLHLPQEQCEVTLFKVRTKTRNSKNNFIKKITGNHYNENLL